jgi:hypothetical protein
VTPAMYSRPYHGTGPPLPCNGAIGSTARKSRNHSAPSANASRDVYHAHHWAASRPQKGNPAGRTSKVLQ